MKREIKKKTASSKISDQFSAFTDGVGTRINEAAKIAGGKKKLAEMAGLSESQLHRIVSGESQAKVEPLAAIARGLGISLEWLATGEGPMRHDENDAAAQRAGEISQELAKKIIDSMTNEGLIKKEWAVPINYFVRIYNDIDDPDAPQDAIDSTVLRLLLDTFQVQLANTEAALEQPIADDKHRVALESLLDYLAGKIDEIQGRLENRN